MTPEEIRREVIAQIIVLLGVESAKYRPTDLAVAVNVLDAISAKVKALI